MRTVLRQLSVAGLCLALALPLSAQDATKSDAAVRELAAVKQALEAKFPGAPIKNVSRSPYFGLYEAQLDDRMLYTDGRVNYVIVGSVYDTATRTNLTEQRMRRMNRVAGEAVRPRVFSTSAVPMTMPVAMAKGHANNVNGASTPIAMATIRFRPSWAGVVSMGASASCVRRAAFVGAILTSGAPRRYGPGSTLITRGRGRGHRDEAK